ncbi:unnamed protein product [Vicia faba]|uniref:Uncharacterized protein n=1 Tax=Vicia faba TaxID=3906 RepID=A0AAV0YH76_VICFA|nr:unnamed protein product [Vicia faba]
MSLLNLNFALIIVAALLLTTTMAQSSRKAISPSPSLGDSPPEQSASSPSISPPEQSASSPSISPSSISDPPSEAPGPASNAVVFNTVSVAAGSALMIFVAALIM